MIHEFHDVYGVPVLVNRKQSKSMSWVEFELSWVGYQLLARHINQEQQVLRYCVITIFSFQSKSSGLNVVTNIQYCIALNNCVVLNPYIIIYIKSKVTVLSPHPGSELCSADFDKYLPWSLGLLQPIYPSGYPDQLPLGRIQQLTRNLAPRLTYLPSQVPTHLLLGRKKQCRVKCLAQGHNEQTNRQGIEPGTWPRS